MSLREYQIDKNLAMILEKYGRDNNISPSMVIEHLLETFLYEKKYIVVDEEDFEEDNTPQIMYGERKSKFSKISKTKRSYLLKYGDLDFGYYKNDEVDDVIDKLLDFSDKELEELDRNKWEYSKRKYSKFIRQKLENPLLTPEEFMSSSRLTKWVNEDTVRFVFYKNNERIQLVHFNRSIYDDDVINDAYLFISGLSDEEICEYDGQRRASDLVSAEFLLKYMEDFGVKRLPYTLVSPSGKVIFQRKGATFGTHNVEKVREVWDFLDSKGWDKAYSTKGTGLTGKTYLNWLYSEMENEKGEV